MADALAHYLMLDSRARCAVAVTTDLVREAQRRHLLGPMATIALGRAMSCAALLASNLKRVDAYVHCTFSGNGPLGKILAECNGAGHCRGYVVVAQLAEVLTETDDIPETVGQAVGTEGILRVTQGHPMEREPHIAITPLQTGEIASDVNRHLVESDQIPSAVAAGVKLSPEGEVLGAGAILIQQLGGQTLEEQELQMLEQKLGPSLVLSSRIASGATTDDLFDYVSGGESSAGKELLRRPLVFQCSCRREKFASTLYALGQEELEDIVAKVGKLETRCSYCAAIYEFQIEEFQTH